MDKEYKIVEWSVPSYGKCLMTFDDAMIFSTANYEKRREILNKYREQFPWYGDGRHQMTFEEYKKTLPKTATYTAPMLKKLMTQTKAFKELEKENIRTQIAENATDSYAINYESMADAYNVDISPQIITGGTIAQISQPIYPESIESSSKAKHIAESERNKQASSVRARKQNLKTELETTLQDKTYKETVASIVAEKVAIAAFPATALLLVGSMRTATEQAAQKAQTANEEIQNKMSELREIMGVEDGDNGGWTPDYGGGTDPKAGGGASSTGGPNTTPGSGFNGLGGKITSGPFVGYGLVNNWSDQNPTNYMEQLKSHNIHCMAFEFFEWNHSFADVDSKLKRFETYIKLASTYGIILYVTLTNSNLGSGKYGDEGTPLSHYNESIMKAARQFAEWMKEYNFIFLTPSGEGGAVEPGYDRQLQAWCKENMPLSQLVNNFGARPDGNDGMGNRCYHPCSTDDGGNNGCWIMSGCGRMIRQLNGDISGGDDVLYGHCDEGTTRDYARKVTSQGKPFIYYHFDRSGSIDDGALNALNGLGNQIVLENERRVGATIDAVNDGTSNIPDDTNWLHTNISEWEQTATLTASMKNGMVRLFYDKANTWPERGELNANVWVIAKWDDDKWYAATWGWLKRGVKSKSMKDLSWGSAIRTPPLKGWEPSPGERVGFMVSGFARNTLRTVSERSNVSWVKFQ